MDKTKRVTFRIDEKTKNKLFDLADECEISVSLYLRRLIKHAFNKKMKF